MENKNLYKGIFCIIFSAFCFALMGMLVHLAGDIFFVQKAFFRNLVSFFAAMIMLVKERKSVTIPKGSFKFLLIRAAAGSIGIFGNFYALDHIPIADAGILNKMSPFFAVLFSLIFLHETIKPVPFMCILGAFAGAVFVIKPSANIMNSFPAIFAFVGGMGAGLAYACVRKLGSMKMTGSVIIAFFSAFSCLLSVPYLVTSFTPMTWQQWLILTGAGIAATGGQFGITYAYYYAPARDISIYDYTQILFSALLGYLAFRQIPDAYSLIGYAVIILMAVIVFLYNKKHGTTA
ncbi:DMT family transporter [uncultured Treponema sp.]|uniref:DMT family transporter n=1 Tax=uncultured Treponema sp. TaxID=162155 RepID=UPI00259311B6|nr:DMT family transporter [uncultured Treponema sp.]